MKEKLDVLIVEDQIDVCEILKHVFRKLEFNIIIATNISEIKKTLEKYEPTTILLDNNLPDGQGFDLIPEIKHTFPDIKIIAMTGKISPHLEIETLNLGADLFIEKPFRISQIYKAMLEVELI